MKYVNYEKSELLDKRNLFNRLKNKLFNKTPFFSPTHIQYVIDKNDDQYFRVIKNRNRARVFEDHNNENKTYIMYSGYVDVKAISKTHSLLTVELNFNIYDNYKTNAKNKHKYLKVC